ncbi:hypothetical protein [Myxococcus xanthus]|uniref:hypothetical protein n=2 Tax=Myxococcus xanthus TaxID=34 RepID=UPI00034AAEDB|nr:hypothetical protein [Myxococcus xanthus]QVW70577.1 hypothetical protein JTM82_13935 [Myxococcus xanthus DZ2]QZZ49469.1 hypothetical protein MyxoNM_09670 [Myxococcus xanthus]UEO03296.1 hypothetical protein K1515_28880 [Myxococcus xanthus DZ2]UYI16543.1 hypothetical protein N3T43_09555 [Myxococcus xanthus]UYI23906.1 hypothetical protein N1129_09560 [Myxococcus xanthus]
MSNRLDFHFRQKVTEAELDLAFAQLEQADRSLASDLGVHGVISGAVPAPHSPVPNLTVDLTAPARAYDNLGQRIFFGTGQTVDCAVDVSGIPTDVSTSGSERWVGIFLRFTRLLSEPRTDGNSQQVYFRRDESFELVVRQAPEGPVGQAPKPALQPDELLLCDVRRRPGQTQILAADLDTSRRQAFIFARGDSVAVEGGAWDVLSPGAETVQATLDAVDAELAGHFSGAARRHEASAVDYAPHGFISSSTVQEAVDEVVDKLSSAAAGTPGASRVGADAVPGTPNLLPAGTVDAQLSSLLGFLNAHQGAATGAHHASAIGATPHSYVSGTSVQAQLQEVVTRLGETTANSPGSSRIGGDALAGTPHTLPASSLRQQVAALLGFLNGHVTQGAGAHAASSVSVADAGNLLTTGTVEAALAEILAAFSSGHYRSNETAAGQHKAILQPRLGTGRALLLDALGVGGAAARLRLYADSDSVWFTLNAAWNGSAWARDTSGSASGGFRLSRNEAEFLHDASTGVTFTTWTRTLRLPLSSTVSNTSFELAGSVREVGRLGLQYSNSDTASHDNLAGGGSVTFRSRFPGVPSSITLSPYAFAGSFVGNPTVMVPDRDGFAFYTHQTLPGLASTYWFGSYTAVA